MVHSTKRPVILPVSTREVDSDSLFPRSGGIGILGRHFPIAFSPHEEVPPKIPFPPKIPNTSNLPSFNLILFSFYYSSKMNANQWSSPLAKPLKKQKEEDPLKDFKKEKCKISKGHAKKIVAVKDVDSAGCAWIERWIDNLVRGNCFPPQLVSDDFYASLPKFFAPDKVLSILEEVRKDYRRAFPLSSIEDDDDLSTLSETLKKDPAVMKEFENLLSE